MAGLATLLHRNEEPTATKRIVDFSGEHPVIDLHEMPTDPFGIQPVTEDPHVALQGLHEEAFGDKLGVEEVHAPDEGGFRVDNFWDRPPDAAPAIEEGWFARWWTKRSERRAEMTIADKMVNTMFWCMRVPMVGLALGVGTYFFRFGLHFVIPLS